MLLLTGIITFVPMSASAQSDASPAAISALDRNVDGLKLHFLKAGNGPTLILIHGYAETSRMWRPIIPELAKRFTVIAPDLPGIGDSAIPQNGTDVIAAARTIHALTRSLGVDRADVVGHDIGLMVAYAYAVQYPKETSKLVVMDAFIPGVVGWESIYDSPSLWHFRFSGPTPEKLVRGRERIYFDYYWNEFAANKDHSLPEADRKAYVAAYSRPGRMKAGWAYFISFPEAAKEFARLSQTKLTMPVLSLGGDKSLGVALGQQMKLVGTNVTVIVLKDAGHWVMEEQPGATAKALTDFLEH